MIKTLILLLLLCGLLFSIIMMYEEIKLIKNINENSNHVTIIKHTEYGNNTLEIYMDGEILSWES